ncbi:LOW QUALITY PROTEIN: reverse transcriptase, partial [Phytophthora megakarya]
MDENDSIARDNDSPELQPLDGRPRSRRRPFSATSTRREIPVVIVYARDWAISASLMQEHNGIYHPVAFASRTLKMNELNYNVIEKEVLALLRILDLYYNLLVGGEVRGRLGQWPALLAPTKGEDEILGAIAASITPRSNMDDDLAAIVPRKEPKRRIQTPIPTVDREEELCVIRFDGSARVKRGGGTFSAIVWSLPGWRVVKARSGYLESLTVNEAEYNGLLLGLDMLGDLDRKRLVIFQLSDPASTGQDRLQSTRAGAMKQKALDRPRNWSDHELVHVKRDWNGSTDSLASAALQRQGGIEVQDLVTLKRLGEILIPKIETPVVRGAAVTTRASRVRTPAGVMQEDLIQKIRVDQIRQAQKEEVWIAGMKKYLSGSIADLTQEEARSYGKIAADNEVDEQDLLFYYPPKPRSGDDRDRLLRLVVPEMLQSDVLHHYHTTLKGRHQGVGRTYQRIRDHFHWRGLYRSVQRYVGECVDCETGKGKPAIRGESPGTLQATYPFQIIAMDHIPSLPRSRKGNNELLIWVDPFTGYVIAKASSSRSAQTVAESYEKCVFRQFGASEMIRYDREPGFISDFFRSFNKILGQRQRATMAYRPQANGAAERMVQTATRALKMYVRDLDQKDCVVKSVKLSPLD